MVRSQLRMVVGPSGPSNLTVDSGVDIASGEMHFEARGGAWLQKVGMNDDLEMGQKH